jgi:hypothetical protein
MKGQALNNLRKNARWSMVNDELEWQDDTQTQPTEAEITAEISRLQAEYDAQAYARDRQYPAIGDQLDMIFHAGLGGDEFQAAIQAVKDANPKP